MAVPYTGEVGEGQGQAQVDCVSSSRAATEDSRNTRENLQGAEI